MQRIFPSTSLISGLCMNSNPLPCYITCEKYWQACAKFLQRKCSTGMWKALTALALQEREMHLQHAANAACEKYWQACEKFLQRKCSMWKVFAAYACSARAALHVKIFDKCVKSSCSASAVCEKCLQRMLAAHVLHYLWKILTSVWKVLAAHVQCVKSFLLCLHRTCCTTRKILTSVLKVLVCTAHATGGKNYGMVPLFLIKGEICIFNAIFKYRKQILRIATTFSISYSSFFHKPAPSTDWKQTQQTLDYLESMQLIRASDFHSFYESTQYIQRRL